MTRLPRFAGVALALCFQALAAESSFDADRYIAHVKFLASPEMRGRATGSPELERAAQYIAGQFKSFGLRGMDGKAYLQAFDVTTNAKLGHANKFEIEAGADSQSLQVGKEYTPINFSASGRASGGVVFAGYGITAPEYHYDDYAGVDVRGKFVIVLAHEPQEFDAKSVFEGKVYTTHSQYYSKAANAKAHGARGVILIADRINHRGDGEELEKFGTTSGPSDAGIAYVQLKEEVVRPWFQKAGKDIEDLETAIDGDLKPRSFAIPQVEIRETVDVERAVKTVHNVAGYLAGSTDEYIIIGAHYDHLGLGEQFSMAPSLAGTVHPGADDNASGTAGVIELARYFAGQPKPKRGILFIAFAGEELGLLGSSFYANHPELPLTKAVTMINLDMIGRVREGKLYVGGTGTGTGLKADLDRVAPNYKFKIDASGNAGYGSSDHISFTAKQVPALFFFSGLHGDYHKPGDTWDKIDSAGAVDVLRLIADLATRIDNDAGRPAFLRVVEKQDPHAGGVSDSASSASGSSASGAGYGPNFGSIPDFAEPPKGVRFADVREGTPAALAGLKPGDILITFGDKDIANLYDFTYALRAHKPGDEVVVEVLRNNVKISAKVKLTERK